MQNIHQTVSGYLYKVRLDEGERKIQSGGLFLYTHVCIAATYFLIETTKENNKCQTLFFQKYDIVLFMTVK